jgi:ribosomal protein S18 acetylase RimI-like enzyme
MSQLFNSVEYATVSESQHSEAISLLVSHESKSEQPNRIATIATELRRNGASTKTLVGACRAGKLIAVTWGQLFPGNIAILWPLRFSDARDETVGDELYSLLNDQLKNAGVRMIQAVFSTGAHPDAACLQRAGYVQAADLLYLASELERIAAADLPAEIDLTTFTCPDRERLSALVERTYVDTLDVPALDGVRDMKDVLNGYEQTGEFSPDRWFFVQHDGEDVGCLLLNDHPQHRQWELVYMGIVPESRGNGWGMQIVRFAQQVAKQAGRERLVLAVDAANDPAVTAYTRAGFFEMLRRTVYLNVFE